MLASEGLERYNTPVSNNEMKEVALKAYRAMAMARAFDSKTSALYKAGKIFGGVFLGRGHEAIAACEAVFCSQGEMCTIPLSENKQGAVHGVTVY